MTPADLVLTRRGLRFMGQYLPCTIGHGGIAAHKSEGDGATPAGSHLITGGFYRADRMAAPRSALALRPIGLNDRWSDDVRDPAYNRLVTAQHYAFSHERLRRADPLYDLVLTTSWNLPAAIPGKGSAIFIHRWRRPGFATAGCVALAPDDLLWVVENLRVGARLIVPENLAYAG